MIVTKSVQLNQECVKELFDAMLSFSINLKGKLTKEQLYCTYILQQLYLKLRTKENRMLDTGRTNTKMKLNSVQALVLIEVLQTYRASMRLNDLIMELGTIATRTA